MGTGGLKIVRYVGKYYVYWNRYDSYLDGVGSEIVEMIPSDPTQYQREWGPAFFFPLG